MFALLAAVVSLLIWVVLLFFHGRFWDVAVPQTASMPNRRKIVAVIPARDEAQCLGATIAALLTQDYQGELRIVLVDDQSTDGTAAIAAAKANELNGADRLTILSGQALPQGWTGKLWAVSQGIAHAEMLAPDYILLTDADIIHDPVNVANLVARAEIEQRDLVSQMVLLRCRSAAEHFLIPAFVFFFFMLYPPRWTADPKRKTAAAAGGSMLIRPEAVRRIGGIQAIKGNLIDDCALAEAVKATGGRIRLDATTSAHSIREYGTSGEIWAMIARSAFTQLRYSTWLLCGTLLGLGLAFLAPPLLALFGHGTARLLGALSWLAMAFAFQPTLALYGLRWPRAFTLPAAALFYAGATFGSAINYWRGRGGKWKGRVQAANAKS